VRKDAARVTVKLLGVSLAPSLGGGKCHPKGQKGGFTTIERGGRVKLGKTDSKNPNQKWGGQKEGPGYVAYISVVGSREFLVKGKEKVQKVSRKREKRRSLKARRPGNLKTGPVRFKQGPD